MYMSIVHVNSCTISTSVSCTMRCTYLWHADDGTAPLKAGPSLYPSSGGRIVVRSTGLQRRTMSGATGDFAAGATVTPPPRGRTRGSTDAQSAAPSQGLRAYYNRVSPNSYMSTAWSSPGARAVEPSPEQHASRRQPIDMSSIPRMLRSHDFRGW